MSESEFVRRLRHRIEIDPGLTAAGLAIKAGLDNSVIRNLFNGKTRNPRLDTMEKICSALETTVDQFMKPDLTPEEREIIRLTALLPDHLRRQILGYVQGVAAALDPPSQESGEDEG